MARYHGTAYAVMQHDQGCKEEIDWFPSYREANALINEITQDQLLHPQWYRHLANPSYVIEKVTIVEESEDAFYGIVEI